MNRAADNHRKDLNGLMRWPYTTKLHFYTLIQTGWLDRQIHCNRHGNLQLY